MKDPEGYCLRVDAQGQATIEASTDAGRFYAEQTLKQLDGRKNFELHDAPRYRWRALHFDVARHFFPVRDVEHLIDLMARLKLNTFHWHLTDDQGWRLPVQKHPELTAGQDAYTHDDIRQVVEYAKQRHITIVPEIDLPGHTRALLSSHPELSCRGKPLPLPTEPGIYEDVLCAGNPATYALLDDVLEELAALFPGPYLHLGGDEVPTTRWDECPRCSALGLHPQTYFLSKVTAKVRALGKRPVGWDEVLDHQPPSDLVVMAWRPGAQPSTHDTVLVPYDVTYLDRAQNPYDDAVVTVGRISAWQPPDALGVEAALWTEYVPTIQRAEVQLFPRLLAFADVAWSTTEARTNNPLDRRLEPVLDALGVASFIDPPAGLEPRRAFIDAGVLELKGATGIIRYTLDGSEPTRESPRYTQPVALSQTADVAARTYVGTRSSPVAHGRIVVEPPLPPQDTGATLHYALYEGRFDRLPDFEQLKPSREGTTDTLVPADVPAHDWALVVEGGYTAKTTGVVRFKLRSDDGARLLIDDREIILDDGLHAPRNRFGELALERGTHRLRVEFFQRGGGYVLELAPR